eukprot:TRINITY_DN22623_c0_g1_i1.p3 TRINITY_DN22623_c0_g1~~TRINITY_DN22623_c0_g1_i1.p3  ORF type:complete len:203 (+),score=-7.13 TRINITY_DN22623_c0_g1_i1:892-1500(+)
MSIKKTAGAAIRCKIIRANYLKCRQMKLYNTVSKRLQIKIFLVTSKFPKTACQINYSMQNMIISQDRTLPNQAHIQMYKKEIQTFKNGVYIFHGQKMLRVSTSDEFHKQILCLYFTTQEQKHSHSKFQCTKNFLTQNKGIYPSKLYTIDKWQNHRQGFQQTTNLFYDFEDFYLKSSIMQQWHQNNFSKEKDSHTNNHIMQQN